MTLYSSVSGGEVGSQVEQESIYISCCPEELIAVEMDAWRHGYDAASADKKAADRTLPDIEWQGEGACEEALRRYVPMNLERFHEIYVRGWCTGYCIRVRELGVP